MNGNSGVQMRQVDSDEAGQRIDNFLLRILRGVPKSLVYRIIRKGEVRINGKRVKPEYKLVAGDSVRLPPIRQSRQQAPVSARLSKVQQLEQCIIHEDDRLLVLNKPAGLAVHGGSGLQFGVIEGLRALRPDSAFLELVHRLDRDTSGVLLIAKKRSALRALHQQLTAKQVDKRYQCLVWGNWPEKLTRVTLPLRKNILKSGERVVRVQPDGKASETRFRVLQKLQGATLLEASPVTGRTHQIRVHTAGSQRPIIGDEKYGRAGDDSRLAQEVPLRLCLHAWKITLNHPQSGKKVCYQAPVPEAMQQLIRHFCA